MVTLRAKSGALVFLILCLLLASVGWGIASAQGGTTTNVTITETEFKLDPAQITVPLNTPVQVTVVNAGKVDHNLKFELPAQNIEKTLFDQNLKPGETKTGSFTFTTAGSWEMYCPVDNHEGAGMKGTVMVMAAAGSTQGQATGAAAQAGTATRAAPSTLPKTGGFAANELWLFAGLAAVAAGLVLRVRTRPGR